MVNKKIRSITGAEIVLNEKAVEELKASLRGELILPEDEGYDDARKVHNGMIDRHPCLILRCAGVSDVVSAVNFARENKLTLAVRGGGHNVAGIAVWDDSVVIDLSSMKSIRVDPTKWTARAAGGCTWGDLDHETHAFGLATTGGIISTTGIAGVTLGGGVGYLTRKCGLSCDNLISVDVVTADGRFITASNEENNDLFWGLRGGGGNFGIATSFEFKLHPVSTVFAGPILYSLEQARGAMRLYRDYMAKAPEDMSGLFSFLVVPPGPPFPEHLHNKTVCGVVCCYAGPPEKAEEVIRPLHEFGPPIFEYLGHIPYPALQSAFDALVPFGLQYYYKADFVKDLIDDAIEVHLKYGPDIARYNSALYIYPTSGVAHRVKKDETAFNYRDADFVHVIASANSDPADTPKNSEWVREYWDALHPHSAGGAYVNFMMEEGEDRIKATYGDNYERLVQIKNKYDPTNLFRVNQNIKPTV